MMPSGELSKNPRESPKGRILRISNHPDGTSRTVLDNGPDRKITIVSFSEDLPALLGEDSKAIHAHIMTRAPGHFRKK